MSILSTSNTHVSNILRYAWWRWNTSAVIDRRVNSGDASIQVRVFGSGQPLILLHGGLSSSLDWYAQMPELARRFRIVCIDSRGHGGSTLGHQRYTYRQLMDDVLAVMNDLGIESAAFAGWSDGANIALMLARYHPQRVGRVIAISANAHPQGLTTDAQSEIAGIDPENPPWLLRIVYFMQSPSPSAIVNLRRKVLKLWQNGPHFSCTDLHEISKPVLLLIGQHDLVALQHAQQMRECLGNAVLEVLDGVGHSVPRSAPRIVLSRMLGFLEEPA